jgi:hypothetical protein
MMLMSEINVHYSNLQAVTLRYERTAVILWMGWRITVRFCIWLGLTMLGILQYIHKYINKYIPCRHCLLMQHGIYLVLSSPVCSLNILWHFIRTAVCTFWFVFKVCFCTCYLSDTVLWLRLEFLLSRLCNFVCAVTLGGLCVQLLTISVVMWSELAWFMWSWI